MPMAARICGSAGFSQQSVTYGLLVGLAAGAQAGAVAAYLVQLSGLKWGRVYLGAGYMIAVIIGAPLIIANFGLYALLSGAENNRASAFPSALPFLTSRSIMCSCMPFVSGGAGIATVLIHVLKHRLCARGLAARALGVRSRFLATT